jgi:hypothetical protein
MEAIPLVPGCKRRGRADIINLHDLSFPVSSFG